MREGLVESRNRLKGEELSCQQRSGMTANTHVGVPPSHSDISRREPLRTLRLAQRWKVNRPSGDPGFNSVGGRRRVCPHSALRIDDRRFGPLDPLNPLGRKEKRRPVPASPVRPDEPTFRLARDRYSPHDCFCLPEVRDYLSGLTTSRPGNAFRGFQLHRVPYPSLRLERSL